MEEKIYDVPPEWTRRAYLDEAGYTAKYEASIRDPEASGARRASGSTGSSPIPGSRTRISDQATSRSAGLRTAPPTSPTTASTATSRRAADQVAIIWEGDDPARIEAYHLSRAARRGLPHGERHAQPRRRQGRPGHDLHADDPRGGLCDARLRADRRRPFRRLRRLLAGFARRPHRGRAVGLRHHRRRGPARRPQGAAQGQCRRGDRAGRRCRPRHRRAPHRHARSTWCRAATSTTTRRPRRSPHECPVRGDERGGSALHPLHLGLDRQAEGRAAHHRRLSRLCGDDAPIRLRLPRRRRLLVHRRRRLGHRPLLHRLRPARQRRDDPDVRRRAQLSVDLPLLGGRSTSTTSTSSTPRRPRSARSCRRARRRCGRPRASRCACSARSASRSTPRPGNGTTASSATAAARSSTPGGRPRPAAS